MPELNHLSYSSISTYIDCARKWGYKYAQKLPTANSPELAFGSAFHATIEDILRNLSTNQGADVRQLWIEHSKRELSKLSPEEYKMGDTRNDMTDLGLSMLLDDEVIKTIGRIRPLMVDGQPVIEKRISIKVPGVPIPIIGFIDCIDHAGIPIDFKTSGKAWYPDRAAKELQTLFYLAAMLQDGSPPANYAFRHIVFPKTGKTRVQVFDHTHTPAQLFWLYGAILDVWKGIQAGAFPPNPGSWLCSKEYCPFHGICIGKR